MLFFYIIKMPRVPSDVMDDIWAAIILYMHLASKGHYIVTSSLTGWAPTQNDPCTGNVYRQSWYETDMGCLHFKLV